MAVDPLSWHDKLSKPLINESVPLEMPFHLASFPPIVPITLAKAASYTGIQAVDTAMIPPHPLLNCIVSSDLFLACSFSKG